MPPMIHSKLKANLIALIDENGEPRRFYGVTTQRGRELAESDLTHHENWFAVFVDGNREVHALSWVTGKYGDHLLDSPALPESARAINYL